MITTLIDESPVSIHHKIQAFARSTLQLSRLHVIEVITPGQFIRQGDIYCIRIEKSAKGWKTTDSRDLTRHTSASSSHLAEGLNVSLRLPDEDDTNRGHQQRQAIRRSLAVAFRLHPNLLSYLELNDAEDENFSYLQRRLGPQVIAKSRFLITHPEHAHFSMPPGIYQIIYQLDFARDEVVMD